MLLLKGVIVRANITDYRFKGDMKQRRKQGEKSTLSSTANGYIGVVEAVADDREDEEGSTQDKNDSCAKESESDEGLACDMELSAFLII